MIRHETSDVHLQASLRCANCRSYLSWDGFHFNSNSEPVCPTACAALPDCSNCGDQCGSLGFPVYSQDGLPFCSPACESFYPKPGLSEGVRRILWAAAASMFLETTVLLFLFLTRLSRGI